MISRARRRAAALVAGLALASGALPALLPQSPAAAAPSARAAAGAPAAATATTTLLPTYDLATSEGGVAPFGGAGYYGEVTVPLRAPVVGVATTADGHGYWLVASDGGIFAFGDAHFRGSTGHIRLNAPIVGMAATADGQGYWLVASDGGIFAFGNAHFRGSTGNLHLNAPIVSMAPTADGQGYWLVASDGGIFAFGDAHFRGSTGGMHLKTPIVGMAGWAEGGYWLLASDGGVFTFGTAHYAGSGAGQLGTTTAKGIAPTPDGHGYWMVSSSGRVLAFGDALFRGDLAHRPNGPLTAAITSAKPTHDPPPGPYPAGSIGYDVNWPQCGATLPGPPSYPARTRSYAVAVVGVDGWGDGHDNSCLSTEAAWGGRAQNTGGQSYELYTLLNAPASSSTIDWSGPAGDCHARAPGSAAWQNCLAYNYGWNSAAEAHSYATSQGASAEVWWLDIENTSCANGNFNGGFGTPWSCDTELNDQTLQAAINALHDVGITVGVYSTRLQWSAIMGSYVPHEGSMGAIPLWIAGAPWTTPPFPPGFQSEAALGPYCGGSYDFAGGVPWLLQETPGSTNYPYDPDYACGGEPA